MITIEMPRQSIVECGFADVSSSVAVSGQTRRRYCLIVAWFFRHGLSEQIDTFHRAYGSSDFIEDISMAEDLRQEISVEGLHPCKIYRELFQTMLIEGKLISQAFRLAISKQGPDDKTPAASYARFDVHDAHFVRVLMI